MTHAHTRSDYGFTLVELMVALVIGVILMSGVISVYITSKSTYNVNNGLGQVEEGGRYALNFLQPIVTMGGYLGCAKATSLNTASGLNVGVAPPPVYDFAKAVYGYEATGTNIGQTITGVNTQPSLSSTAGNWTPSLTNNDTASVLFDALKGAPGGELIDGSDVLIIHEAGADPVWLVGPTYADPTNLYMAGATSSAPVTAANFNVGEIALVANCSSGSSPTALQVTGVTPSTGVVTFAAGIGTPGNTGTIPTFGAGAALQSLQSYVFYVGKGVDGWPALFEASFNSTGTLTPTQIVSGVENMEVLYGVDTDGDTVPNNFQTADTVDAGSNWPNVVSVRIALLMQSDDGAIDQMPAATTNVYMLGINSSDSVIFKTPIDRRLRRYFVQTISLRNKLQ